MPFPLARPGGRPWTKIRANVAFDRYEAAIRLERARQRLRELVRYGFTVTESDAAECVAAVQEYDSATAAWRY